MDLKDLGYTDIDASELHPVVQKVIKERSIRRNINSNRITDPMEHKLRVVNYEVQRNDTLLGVALKFRTATEIIKYMNKIDDNFAIGQKLVILPGHVVKDLSELDDISCTTIHADIYGAHSLFTPSTSALAALSTAAAVADPCTYALGSGDEPGTPLCCEEEERIHCHEQKRAAAESVVPYAIRSYLRFKCGYMYECSSVRKFYKVWCVLVDQHFLVYAEKKDKYPMRILCLHCRNIVVTNTNVTLCITLDGNLLSPDMYEVQNCIYYRLDNAKEAADWKELLMVLATNSVGTSQIDSTSLSFGEFFADITCLPWKKNHETQLGHSDELGLRTADATGGIKKSVFCVLGEPLADSALDGIWDIDQGRFALEEKSPVLMRVLAQCRDIILRESVEYMTEDGVKNVEMNLDGQCESSPIDRRILEFIGDIWHLPPWADTAKMKRGSDLLLEHILLVSQGLVSGAAVQIACSAEGAALIASLEAANDYSTDNEQLTAEPGESQNCRVQMTREGSAAGQNVSLFLSAMVQVFFDCLQGIAGGNFTPFRGAHMELVEIRMQFAVMRRLVLSVSGIGWWDDSYWGMPLSSRFLSYCLRVVIMSCVESLSSVLMLTAPDKEHIIHLLAVVGCILGIRDEKLRHACRYEDLIVGVVDEGVRRRSISLMSTAHRQSVSPHAIKSPSKHVTPPQDDVAFTGAIVNKIIDTAMKLPQPWAQRFTWHRSTQLAFARRFQPSLQGASGLDKDVLPLSIASAAWLFFVMWYSFIVMALIPLKWVYVRDILHENSDRQCGRLKHFFCVDVMRINRHDEIKVAME